MYKVIIIDDNRLLADTLAKLDLWEKLDCSIEAVCYDSISGEKAILEIRPDILLTDIKLPSKDGLEVVSEVLQSLPDVKVVCMSAYDDFPYSIRALRLKCEDYLLKPFSPEELHKVIRQIVNELNGKMEETGEEANEKHSTASTQDGPLLGPIIQYIADNLDKGYTAEEVAREFYISTSKLNRLIRQRYNKGFREFRIELCMKKAKELLLDVRYSVEEVARKVGYMNYFSFYRAFIREHGISPTDFRNASLTGEETNAGTWR